MCNWDSTGVLYKRHILYLVCPVIGVPKLYRPGVVGSLTPRALLTRLTSAKRDQYSVLKQCCHISTTSRENRIISICLAGCVLIITHVRNL